MNSEALWELVKLFLAALLASTLTHLLTHRRFIQGRWWDRKADVYGKIIGALVNMEYFLRAQIDFGKRLTERWESGHRIYTSLDSVLEEQKDMKRVDEGYGEALDEIKRVAIEGDYVISRKAAKALSELVREFSWDHGIEGLFWESPSKWAEIIDLLCSFSVATSSCLEIVRAEAQSDLRVKWYSL